MAARTIVMLAVVLLYGSAATAQTEANDRILQSLSECRRIAAPESRLDCFDKMAAALEQAVKSKEVTVVDRQDIRRARRSLFGFVLPQTGLFGGSDGDERGNAAGFEELETTIVSARAVANSRFELRLADGDAVWVTTDPLSFAPRSGAKIRIRKGALGNYFLAIAGERTVRGVRLR